ncbi:hypothetical protein PENTCL1PPCAC_16354 [Pristionchus entomophagus]|uniref:C2H2-type domain-containing protein n=1 Tax=Pristionchus entomophagus TaxID=358040 RepID=A0AAV5TJ52_9BILA|nr:hypothetical protein PENTCL1PPCAC_16354 [Pristionchus entomophagus]
MESIVIPHKDFASIDPNKNYAPQFVVVMVDAEDEKEAFETVRSYFDELPKWTLRRPSDVFRDEEMRTFFEMESQRRTSIYCQTNEKMEERRAARRTLDVIELDDSENDTEKEGDTNANPLAMNNSMMLANAKDRRSSVSRSTVPLKPIARKRAPAVDIKCEIIEDSTTPINDLVISFEQGGEMHDAPEEIQTNGGTIHDDDSLVKSQPEIPIEENGPVQPRSEKKPSIGAPTPAKRPRHIDSEEEGDSMEILNKCILDKHGSGEKKKKDEVKNLRNMLGEDFEMDDMLDDDAGTQGNDEAPANDSVLTALSNEAFRELHVLGVDLPHGVNETGKTPKAKTQKEADKSRVTDSSKKRRSLAGEDNHMTCTKCVKPIKVTSAGLRKHAFTHAKETRFKCTKCDFGQNEAFMVKKHMAEKHSIEDGNPMKMENPLRLAFFQFTREQCFPEYKWRTVKSEGKVHECKDCEREVKESHIYEHIVTEHGWGLDYDNPKSETNKFFPAYVDLKGYSSDSQESQGMDD